MSARLESTTQVKQWESERKREVEGTPPRPVSICLFKYLNLYFPLATNNYQFSLSFSQHSFPSLSLSQFPPLRNEHPTSFTTAHYYCTRNYYFHWSRVIGKSVPYSAMHSCSGLNEVSHEYLGKWVLIVRWWGRGYPITLSMFSNFFRNEIYAFGCLSSDPEIKKWGEHSHWILTLYRRPRSSFYKFVSWKIVGKCLKFFAKCRKRNNALSREKGNHITFWLLDPSSDLL